MSSTIILGGRRWCTLSIQWRERSASAARFSGRLSHFVSKRPIWLAEAAKLKRLHRVVMRPAQAADLSEDDAPHLHLQIQSARIHLPVDHDRISQQRSR